MLATLCNEIHKLFLSGIKGTNRELFNRAYELSHYFVRHPATLESLELVFELERKLCAGRGPHKQFVEGRVFEALCTSALYCAPDCSDKKCLTENLPLLQKTTCIEEKQEHMIALKLVDFSREVFQLHIPRDAFNSKRKSLALELIGKVAVYYDIPEAYELCTAALQSKKKSLVLAALEFYEIHWHGQDRSLSPELITQLNEIISKTKDRSVAVTALNLQVEAGVASELEALSRIDDWKERNQEWR
ncbi:MAG: hypothetical protein U9R66_14210 [Thermodesulfobacteriota bacterium]|nr:hypothetical protein [Thermodesulfobacteriota bacterium]